MVLVPWFSFQSVTNKRYFGTQSLIPFGFNIAEPHLVARPLKKKKKRLNAKYSFALQYVILSDEEEGYNLRLRKWLIFHLYMCVLCSVLKKTEWFTMSFGHFC